MTLTQSLKALADEKRLKILRMILHSDLCVGALARHLDISKPAVSQHLQVLRKAGLVKGEKRGYWTHYGVNREALVQVAEALKGLATQDTPRTSICWRIEATPLKTLPSQEVAMCRNGCQQPDRLKGQPENCSPEQVRECHGDAQEHPCSRENCAPADK